MSLQRERVLVVDDDDRVLRLIRRILEMEGYAVVTARNGASALEALDAGTPALAILDVMLPDMDGFTLCRRIRQFSKVPIVMVTARDSDVDKVKGLDTGADDYVVKPFSAGELTARVRAVLRRAKPDGESTETVFDCDDLTVDLTRKRVTVSGREVQLTATEHRLLCCMVSNAGRVLTPDQILTRVWGEAYGSETHLLQVHIARLRKKLGDNARKPRYILTKPGIGYIVKEAIT